MHTSVRLINFAAEIRIGFYKYEWQASRSEPSRSAWRNGNDV